MTQAGSQASTDSLARLEAYNVVVNRAADRRQQATPTYAVPSLLALAVYGLALLESWHTKSGAALLWLGATGIMTIAVIATTAILSYRYANAVRERASRDAAIACALAFLDDSQGHLAMHIARDLGAPPPPDPTFDSVRTALTAEVSRLVDALAETRRAIEELAARVAGPSATPTPTPAVSDEPAREEAPQR